MPAIGTGTPIRYIHACPTSSGLMSRTSWICRQRLPAGAPIRIERSIDPMRTSSDPLHWGNSKHQRQQGERVDGRSRPIGLPADRTHDRSADSAQQEEQRQDDDGADQPFDHDGHGADHEEGVRGYRRPEVVLIAASPVSFGDEYGYGTDCHRRQIDERPAHGLRQSGMHSGERETQRNAHGGARKHRPPGGEGKRMRQVHGSARIGASDTAFDPVTGSQLGPGGVPAFTSPSVQRPTPNTSSPAHRDPMRSRFGRAGGSAFFVPETAATDTAASSLR